MRLHELAKEIGAESKILLNLAKELGLKARNQGTQSFVDPDGRRDRDPEGCVP
jgi:hypothetical protein